MKFHLDPKEPCVLCGVLTDNLDHLCHPCWELKGRIEADPDIARMVLDAIEEGKKA